MKFVSSLLVSGESLKALQQGTNMREVIFQEMNLVQACRMEWKGRLQVGRPLRSLDLDSEEVRMAQAGDGRSKKKEGS